MLSKAGVTNRLLTKWLIGDNVIFRFLCEALFFQWITF